MYENLNNTLQKLLQREQTDRYQDPHAVQTDLDYYIYNDGYSPTNEKLTAYMGKLFADSGLFTKNSTHSGNTIEATD